MIYNRFNREISCHRITVLVSHLPCPLPPNQSVICLAPCHQTSQSFDLPSTTASPHHRVSQSFALPPATKPVSHLTCPLPPNQSVIWLAPCHQTSQSFDLPSTTASLHQSVICLAPCHQTSQSFDLPSTTVSPHHHITVSPHHHVSQSFALPPATKPVSHLTCPLPLRHHITMLVSHLPCPLPPNQSVICLAPCHQTSQSFALPSTTASPCHCVSQSFALAPATKPVSHLPCPLPPNQSVIWLALYHCITASDFPHHMGMNLIG